MRWLPFQLNPDLPESGIPRREYIESKWGPGKGPEVYSRVAGVGRTVDIPFAFENIVVQPNTLNAHRLLGYAEQQGRQDETAEVLFKAYFLEGADLTDIGVLADVAARAGLDREATARYLESDADAPNLMFVHIGEPDYAGHIFGWMSGTYGLAVRQADRAVAEIVATIFP